MSNLYEKHVFGVGKSRISDKEWKRLLDGYKQITGGGLRYMSRYIEEEYIIKAIDESGQRYGITTANQCNFKEIVRKTPTADVVSKSEVDLYKRQVDELEDELAQTYDKLEAAKTEVAREIFDEIESVLFAVARPCASADGTIIAKHSKDFHFRREDYYTIKEKYTKGGEG